ncbi:glutathione S-transferase family protein [Parasphingopyxis lamellibrachiae]|uniref:Glutathione S-transferase n=1 Tax=Parasphingopyxis lamellibrachiae TaxID=680125 RepID=A0A3D9FFZ0_9SPHN|nr:glutathione S-transferase family protein [Parasphingopyxis lamellibrachiae]RED16011.1 glutathione S-transferase [Parasphingopyxis lamellibrachiae]
MKLYGHTFSSYSWKGLIPFYACDIPFEFRMIDQDNPANAAFVQQAHPAGKFPVLRDDGTVIVEATAIIEYLAATQAKGAGLIPAEPRDAVTVRMLDRVFDNYVMGTAQLSVNAHITDADNPDPAMIEAASTGLLRAYRWIENWLGENIFPAHVSLATCAAAPSLFYADWVERIPEDCPRLAALRAELLALPSVSRCVEDARPYRSYFPLGAPDRD